MKKALRITGIVLEGLFAAAAVGLILLYFFGIRFYIVTTGSMSPAIPEGSLCVVNRNVPFSEIVPGDVISFRIGENATVTHRAVRIEAGGIVTQGDANNAEDTPVTESTYVGKTVWSIPRLGYAVRFLRSRAGITAAIALFVLLLIPMLFRKTPADADAPGQAALAVPDPQKESDKETHRPG